MPEEITELLREQFAATLRYSASLAARMRLGISEVAALEHLHAGDELTPGQLGERLSMSSGAVTSLVDRLERSGYLERGPNPRDRRSTILRATPLSAERVVEQLLPMIVDIRDIVADLSVEERAVVAEFMRRVTSTVERHARTGDGDGS